MNLIAIQDFAGGNDKQRTHLNALVKQVNDLTTELDALKTKCQLLTLLEGCELVISQGENQGEKVIYLVPARKIADIQP